MIKCVESEPSLVLNRYNRDYMWSICVYGGHLRHIAMTILADLKNEIVLINYVCTGIQNEK